MNTKFRTEAKSDFELNVTLNNFWKSCGKFKKANRY